MLTGPSLGANGVEAFEGFGGSGDLWVFGVQGRLWDFWLCWAGLLVALVRKKLAKTSPVAVVTFGDGPP